MRMKKYNCLVIAVLFFQQVTSQVNIIKNVTIIDVKTGKALQGQSVVINNERIEATVLLKK